MGVWAQDGRVVGPGQAVRGGPVRQAGPGGLPARALRGWRAAAGCALGAWLGLAGAAQDDPARKAQQAPAYTRAEAQVEELATGLSHPWAMAFLPDGSALITERSGALRRWDGRAGLSGPLAGVPEVAAQGQGGLLDVALSPSFAEDRMVYLSYAEAGEDGRLGTAVGRGRLAPDNGSLQDFRRIFQQQPKLSRGQHFGSRLVFDRDGYLFVTLGENNQRPTAQDLDKLQGKLVRLNADGSVPQDNPFQGKPPARPEIWSYGHRNPQGLALHPRTGALWLHEHGARGGDEINLPLPGRNYGWPIATYGMNYSGLPIPESRGTEAEGTEQPLYYWRKSPAVSGMAFYDADRHPQWRGSLFIGSLVEQQLIRLSLDGERIAAEERLLSDRGERIRDVRAGPDGGLYVLTDSPEGKLLRVSPR